MKRFLFYTCLLVQPFFCSSQVKILFDASQAEMAGNADWVIDANTYNIGFSSSGAAVAGTGNEANPAINPSPAQSGISASTPETYWSGALSSWAIDLVKLGYQVETLPYNGTISFGNASNAQDLGNYKVFIVCEPNIRFTSSEKTALINFVQNGGGLFMIADHDQSDRNGDGWDAPAIWNDLVNNNTVQANPFGLQFDLVDISETSYNYSATANDTITNGVTGTVYGVKYSNGAMITRDTAANASAKGILYEGGALQDQDSILLGCANYGNGRVAAFGDSSPCDDGTGDVNDNLYYGYTDLSGYHRKLLLNTTIWLAGNYSSFATSVQAIEKEENFLLYPNPAGKNVKIKHAEAVAVLQVYDLQGRLLLERSSVKNEEEIDLSGLFPGTYIVVLSMERHTVRHKLVISSQQ